MDGHVDTFGTQQRQQRQRKGAVPGVSKLNTSTYYSLQYLRQVHNPLMFHCWFPCILRLSVTPLPMGLLFVFALYYVLPGMCCVLRMCYVLRGAVVRDASCVVVRFHALLRPLNCGPRATYLVEFSMVLAVHIIHST